MTGLRWTNPSVRALAGDRDPVEVVGGLARNLVFDARERGWSGPPYDPFKLADQLGVHVVPVGDLEDARLVHANGDPRIEFNPNRPRARVRFSVAHELGHLLFPDVAEQVRYRSHSATRRGDDWQIELLCNLAAAEFLMPVGSLPELEGEALDINFLMALRAQYAVSTEALLLRLARLTPEPVFAFAAARIDPDSPHYRVDYAVGSRAWLDPGVRGSVWEDGPLADCTAVGYTSRGTLSDTGVHIECVGVPAYPGERYPRVAGFARPLEDRPRAAALEYVHGDATDPRVDGKVVLAHVVNDEAKTWGGRGFAVALRGKRPEAHEQFRAWAEHGVGLGDSHVAELDDGVSVFSMVAQKGYGNERRLRLRYRALETCLSDLGDFAAEQGATVHMPLIGTGQAGGDWPTIKELILGHVSSRGVKTTVYLLPGTPVPEPQMEYQMALPA